MPRAFVEFPARPRHGDGHGAGDQVGRAGEDEGDGLVEAKGLDDGGEEVFEAVGGETGRGLGMKGGGV